METREHIIWETPNCRYSVENVILGKIVRSNISCIGNAEEYIGEAEGTLVADDQVGYLNRNGNKLRSIKKHELKTRDIGEVEKGWTYLGGSTRGDLDKQYSVWLSPKGRYSLERRHPEKSLLSGLTEKELHTVLERIKDFPEGNISYQMPLFYA